MRRVLTYPGFLALLLTVTFAGCHQELLPEIGDAISFSFSYPTLAAGTKADLTDESNIGTILLYGSKLSAGATEKVSFFGPDGSSPSTTLEKSGEAWNYDPLKYWEQGASYDFRAIHPSSAVVTTGSYSGEIVVSGFSIGSGYDLMVASQTGVESATQAGTAVPLEFKHACGAVRFLFKDGNEDYYIKSFELQGLTTSGTMTYNSTNSLPTWGSTSTATYAWPGTTPWEVPEDYDDGTGLEGWYFIIPQDLTDAAELRFVYTVGASGTQEIPVTVPLKGGVGVNTSGVTSWARANAYTYKITIRPDYISLSVGFDAWEDGAEWSLTD